MSPAQSRVAYSCWAMLTADPTLFRVLTPAHESGCYAKEFQKARVSDPCRLIREFDRAIERLAVDDVGGIHRLGEYARLGGDVDHELHAVVGEAAVFSPELDTAR